MDFVDQSEKGRIICGLPAGGKPLEFTEMIAAELDKPDGGGSSKLFAEYCEQMQQQAGDQSEHVILQGMARIDEKEKDGLGIDVAVKFGEDGRVEQATFLAAEFNLTAKEFAANMDTGNHKKAAELLDKIMPTMSADDMVKFLQAVDAYELDGKGEDITIDSSNAAPSISWTLNELEIVNDKKN